MKTGKNMLLPDKMHMMFRHLTSFYYMVKEVAKGFIRRRYRKKSLKIIEIVRQMMETGVNSISLVFLVSLFFGLTLAMLTAYQLKQLNSEILIGALVGVSFTRELGPLLTALVLSGRIGAAFTAEIGTMKVSEEVDALETMGVNPVQYLVMPRISALVVMVPCLTVFSNITGMFGGYLIGRYSLRISTSYYISKTINALVLKDIYTGLIKSVTFALIIALVGCYQGLIVQGGAEGVGKSTTNSVVVSMMLVIIADSFWNAVFYFL
jgi:phospholipid/cholesterol/gamma-HCH transport system permease protein